MNSIAQQAVPNGSGHSELPRAQSTTASSFVVRYVPLPRSSTSRSASPGRVIRPFSAPWPGATPALRGMIESARSIVLTGRSVLDGAGYLGASTRVGRRFYAIWENFHKVEPRAMGRMRDARRARSNEPQFATARRARVAFSRVGSIKTSRSRVVRYGMCASTAIPSITT